MSNAEYDYTIRDLTGVDIHPTKEFPVDPANEAGFDNSGESLSMSPALVKKYLDAARLVSEHLVLKPNGFVFAPFPVTAETDRDKYAVRQIIQFYQHQPTDLAAYFQAAWCYKNRDALGYPQASLTDCATDAGVSSRYLETVWSVLEGPLETVGPIAALQAMWRELPAPEGDWHLAVQLGCVSMRDFVVQLRDRVKPEYKNLNVRGVAPGSQTLVLWKDRQYATHRMMYVGGALDLDMAVFAKSDPAMVVPADESTRQAYEGSFKRFCAVFPDEFYVSERARVFLEKAKEIEAEKQNAGRLLSAGFHSQMGYFRDDTPLCDLILDDGQRAELDELWKELDFITLAPIRQHKQFIWFERAEPPSFMYSSEFNSFRSEDEDITSEEKIRQLAEVYVAKVKKNGVNEMGVGVVQEYFDRINAAIRAVEAARMAAEPSHLEALLDFARRAYRQPLSRAQREEILDFYHELRTKDGLSHEDAVRDSVVSILMSPYFTYRVDRPEPGDGAKPLSDYELASRLSYFLWSSTPDEELLNHAKAGDLHQPDVLLAQAHRMLKDARIQGFATEFGANWLDIRRFEEHNAVDRERFPSFTNDLREAMFQEPIRFLLDLIQNDRSILDMLYGDYTFVNPILAKHYGMPDPDVASDVWVRVDHASQYERGGLLPMSVFLTKNAPGLRTSPVKRGYWVVLRLLGQRIPAPPPNVPVLPADESKLGDLTLRQALARHREDQSCAACHEKFDSFGLVFEGFGPIGEVRAKDLGGKPVEIAAQFPDGSEGSGLEGLRKYIRDRRQDDFIDNLCRKLLVYSLGRSLVPSDEPLVQQMRSKLSAGGNRFDVLIDTIVTSPQFLSKRGLAEVARE